MQTWTIRKISRNVNEITFWDVPASESVWLLLTTDVHHDNPKCRQDIEKKHLAEAIEYNAPLICNGDRFCAMQGKYDRRSNKTAIRPEHQTAKYLDSLVDTAIEFYRPFASIFAVLGRGNHETKIQDVHETDLTDRLAVGLRSHGSPVETSGYGGWVRITFKKSKGKEQTNRGSFWLHHYHGTGGGGPVTKGTIQTNRIAADTPDARVVFTGHTHDSWIFPIRRQRISERGNIYHDDQLHLRAPGYKDAWDDGDHGFEVEKRHGPKGIGALWLQVTPDCDGKPDRLLIDAQRAQ